MALQVFRTTQHVIEVTILTVDQAPWFEGREVAACLGYTNAQKALRDHVDEQDKKTYEELMGKVVSQTPSCKQHPHEVYVNESGLYSLVRRSQKWHSTVANLAKKKKQTTMYRYLKKKAGSTEAGEEGEEDVSSSNSMEA